MKRILIVDDDSLIITLIDSALDAGQYETRNASNVLDAMHLIDTENFDCLITDIILPPGEDGTKLMKYVREKYPKMAVLAITGGVANATKDYVHLADMFSDYTLAKPFGKGALNEALGRVSC